MNTSGRCQSCGMPLKNDPNHGGTNANGTLSESYCSYCYRDGKFLNPDMTLEQMKTRVVEKLHDKGLPRFIGGFFTFGLKNLERWRTA